MCGKSTSKGASALEAQVPASALQQKERKEERPPSIIKTKKKPNKRLFIIVAVIVVIVALAATIVACVQEKKHTEIKNVISSIEASSDLAKVAELLDTVPFRYGDLTIIQEQYARINNQYQTLITHVAYSKTTKNSEIIRSSFENLCRLDAAYPDWDLTGLLNSVLKQYKVWFVYGKEWSCPWKINPDKKRVFLWNENGIDTSKIYGFNALDFEFTDIYFMDEEWTLVLKDLNEETFILH